MTIAATMAQTNLLNVDIAIPSSTIQIAAKNLLVCTGLPVESEEICVCVAVECRWMHMDRERGEGSGEGESMRDLGKRRRHGLGG